MLRRLPLILGFLVLVVSLAPQPAQAGWGGGVQWAAPSGDFSNAYKDGFGLWIKRTQPLIPFLSATFDADWSQFKPKDGLNLETENAFGLTVGGRLEVLVVYLGLEGGYFINLNEWDIVPSLGFRFLMLDVGARYKAGGDSKFFQIRGGVIF
jgi:hypothetical protein